MSGNETAKHRSPNLLYGYVRDSNGLIVTDAAEAEVVRRIFDMYVSKRMCIGRIVLALNSSGCTTKHGKPFQQVTVRRILTSAYYCGSFYENGRKIYRPELRLVDAETFAAASEILSDNRKKNAAFVPSSGSYPYSGLLRCKCCGSVFRRLSRTYKNTYVNWVCMSRNMNGVAVCPNSTSIPESELSDVLRSYFGTVLSRQTEVRRLILNAYAPQKGTHNFGADDVRSLISETFDNLKTLCEAAEFPQDVLHSVVQRILVDEEGNIDVFLTLFERLGISRNVLVR